MGARHYTSAVDVWSTGCIMAELLSRRILFQAQTPMQQVLYVMLSYEMVIYCTWWLGNTCALASSVQESYVQDWCWCGSVLMALLPATSPNSAFLLPLLQVVSITGQPRRAYYKFPESEPRSAGGALLLRDHLCGTVFLLLYGDQRWHCTLSRDNWRPICSTSDVLANRRNIHHWCCCNVFMILVPDTKQQTYLRTYLTNYCTLIPSSLQ